MATYEINLRKGANLVIPKFFVGAIMIFKAGRTKNDSMVNIFFFIRI